VISLIDEISYLSAPAPLTSQYNDINPEQFCNGDNRPADCGPNCMCTHKIDIPLNAIVEVVLVDEGKIFFCTTYFSTNYSPIPLPTEIHPPYTIRWTDDLYGFAFSKICQLVLHPHMTDFNGHFYTS